MIKVVWVVNVPPLAAPRSLGVVTSPMAAWIDGALAKVSGRGELDVTVVFPARILGGLREAEAGGIKFVALPELASTRVETWVALFDRLKPDLVHGYGTERQHNEHVGKACRLVGVPFIVSIQGSLWGCAEHAAGGLLYADRVRPTVIERLRRRDLTSTTRSYGRHVTVERNVLNLANVVLGRTEWDQLICRLLAPGVPYKRVGEVLRPSFEGQPWNASDCIPGRIFITRGDVPLKGLHVALRAVNIINDSNYAGPRVLVRVAGPPLKGTFVRKTGYGRFISDYIKRNLPPGAVTFTGSLDARGVAHEMRSANVFCLPSQIENSPNSLGEAMALGVPVVASAVGGVPEIIRHGHDGLLYPAGSSLVLAGRLLRQLEFPDEAARMGANARQSVWDFFQKDSSMGDLLGVYAAEVGKRQ